MSNIWQTTISIFDKYLWIELSWEWKNVKFSFWQFLIYYNCINLLVKFVCLTCCWGPLQWPLIPPCHNKWNINTTHYWIKFMPIYLPRKLISSHTLTHINQHIIISLILKPTIRNSCNSLVESYKYMTFASCLCSRCPNLMMIFM